VAFTLRAGDGLGIIGPSGSGKSTVDTNTSRSISSASPSNLDERRTGGASTS
jgi:ABC-type protease/lipase transport system fused ATPase/permease subunit